MKKILKIISVIAYSILFISNFILTFALYFLALFHNCYGMIGGNLNSNICHNYGGGLFSLIYLDTYFLVIISVLFIICSIVLIYIIRKSKFDLNIKNIITILICLSLLTCSLNFSIFKYINKDYFDNIKINYCCEAVS